MTSRTKEPFDALVFDCDGTLSSIEGIDQLALMAQTGPQVAQLTEEAMSQSGLNQALFAKRLDLIQPTQQSIQTLAQSYWEHQTPDIYTCIQVLKSLGKTIYIASAGLLPAVAPFGQRLGVKKEHCFAVAITFDAQGLYLGFDQQSPLVLNEGKKQVVQSLAQSHRKIGFVGDGCNDVACAEVVDFFIGYGFLSKRTQVQEASDVYLTCKSMAPILPLILTHDEKKQLSKESLAIFQYGVKLLKGD